MAEPENSAGFRLARRHLLGAAGVAAVMGSALAEEKPGPPSHPKGPKVFLDYDQVELDAAYDQDAYAANRPQLLNRYASASEQEAAHQVFALLEFPDDRAHALAAKAAADMVILESILLLVNQLRNAGPVPALAAAKALADLGTEGRDLLENEILTNARPQYALQALEQSLVAERG